MHILQRVTIHGFSISRGRYLANVIINNLPQDIQSSILPDRVFIDTDPVPIHITKTQVKQIRLHMTAGRYGDLLHIVVGILLREDVRDTEVYIRSKDPDDSYKQKFVSFKINSTD